MTVMTTMHAAERSSKPQIRTMTAAEFLIEQLAEWGVKRIFGVIGDANLYVLDALANQNRIQYIECRHECSAALMASAEAKLTGRIGVCLATSGPGIANLLNGLADASADHVPVLAITGQVDTKKIGTSAKQYINQQQLIAPIAMKSELAAHADALPVLMKECMLEAKVSRKVAHLSVPKDLWLDQIIAAPAPYPVYVHQELQTPNFIVQEAATRISAAHRPVILAGKGIHGIEEQIVQLAELLQAAVVTTYPARPLFPNDHPQYVGGLGQGGSEASSTLIGESDLILILGATWWPDEYVQTSADIVQIDQSPRSIGSAPQAELAVIGDLKLIVPALQAVLTALDRQTWLGRIQKVRTDWKARTDQESALDDRTVLSPQQVMTVLSDWAAANAVIAVDTGDHTLWFNRIFQAVNQDILISGKWRTLGFALPAAIAAQLEYPDRQVVAIAGDGGSIQTIMELVTAVQYRLPIVMIIINNGSYAMEKNRMLVAGLNPLGSDLTNPDFVMLAAACGAAGYKASTAEELKRSLKQASGQHKPTIIEVMTESAMVPHTKL